LRLEEALPELAAELVTGLRSEGEHELAASIRSLEIKECSVGGKSAIVYAMPPREAERPANGDRDLFLSDRFGSIVRVIDEQIAYVEMLKVGILRPKLIRICRRL
jgi:hypothetical protein